MATKKPHGIRSLDHPVKKIHVRVDCDNCYKWETVSMYEDEVEDRLFHNHFFECGQCGNIFCSVCTPSASKLKCPLCAADKSIKLKPFDIYLCNVCLQEWHPDKLCGKCRYRTD
ncbi:hypothetical protein ACFLRF_01915 [Candidatus Altiarchaeota archaeon]